MNDRRRLLTTAAGMLAWLLTTGVVRADVNATPIAVPLIGTSGPGSPYPSTITLSPPGGPTDTSGFFYVTLHAVTHPCPEDLAVLLVHNGIDKYLVMSHAGGCRPLQGSDLTLTSSALSSIPDEDATTTPYGNQLYFKPSNYGTTPAFPAPAPGGPYVPGLPSSATPIQGRWDLYVMDLNPSNRGVIAAGWSIAHDRFFLTPMHEMGPVTIPDNSTASIYPITFDLTDVPIGFVHTLHLYVVMAHGYADDVRMLLQSPGGTTVVVMANAGGNSHIDTQFDFWDGAPSAIPDAGPLPTGSLLAYKPSAYDLPLASFTAPAPAGPYATTFSVFTGQDVRGTWRLWVLDDESPDGGTVFDAALGFDLTPDPPMFSIDTPTTATSYTAAEPFLDVVGVLNNVEQPVGGKWRNVVDGVFYDAGPLILEYGRTSGIAGAHVPLKHGTNSVMFYFQSSEGNVTSDTINVTLNELTYSLSEGSTGGFFDEDVTLGNASDVPAPVTVNFLQEGAAPIVHLDTVAANAPLQLHVDDLVPGGAVSTVVHSTNGVPLAVERTMSWDSTGYGGSGGTSVSPALGWFFAEGSQGYFDTYLLLANDNDLDVDATVRFLMEGGGVVNHPVTIAPHTRRTIYAGDIPELRNSSFGMSVSATLPIVAERSMYFPHGAARIFEGGHEAAGATNPSSRWFLAEGATGPFFECFILLSNPSGGVAHATLTYLLPSGETVTQSLDVPANGRSTVNVETVDPRLLNTPVSTIVTSDRGIIVERSMYWPDASIGWREAHNSVGVIDPAPRWGVSDVRVGGPRDYQTYILLANPNPVVAEVQVRLLRPGAPPIAQSYLLPPTSRTNVFAADLAGAAGTYSADVQVLNFQPIVVEKAMYWNSGSEIWAAGTGVVATPLPPR